MLFIEDAAPGAVRAVVAWTDPAPLLTEACALFERFGLRVAAHRAVEGGWRLASMFREVTGRGGLGRFSSVG
ncbi:hypothetical protein [Mycobacterium sp. URHB0021]|jgi:hypothetical protein